MNKNLNISFLLVSITGMAQAATVVFDFNNSSAFDTVGAGATMAATGDGATIIMTSVDILVPEYTGDPESPSGNTLSSLGLDNVRTNILSSSNAIGIDNPSITNPNYTTDLDGPSDESSTINFGEAWVVSFDTDITFTEFNFSSLDVNEVIDVTVAGNPTTFSFGDGSSLDDFDNPLGSLVIPANTQVTFTGAGTLEDTAVRITEITVIPEPSNILLAALGAGLLGFRRKR